jgi:primosomal replication protein N
LNRLQLSAKICLAHPIRYTPAGVPVLELVLEHESEQPDAGFPRLVKLSLKAIAFGATAEVLAKASFDVDRLFTGFLGLSRNGKGVVFHIQDSHSS